MTDERVITKDELKSLIKQEGLKPEDLFDEKAIKELTEKARADGYAEGSFIVGWKKSYEEDKRKDEEKQKESEKSKKDKYLDPSQNPFIKTNSES